MINFFQNRSINTRFIISAPVVFFYLYLSIFMLNFFNSDLRLFSINWMYYMFSAWACFTFFYVIGSKSIKNKINFMEVDLISSKKIIINIYILFCIFGVCIYIANIYMLDMENYFSLREIRAALTVELQEFKIPFYWIFNPFYFMAVPFVYSYYRYMKKTDILLILFCTIIFFILSSSRSTVIVSVLISLFFICIKQNKINLNIIFICLLSFCLILFLFNFIGYITGKNSESMTFLFYFVAPSNALDVLINCMQLEKFNDLFLTFRPIQNILLKIGLISKKAQLLPYIDNISYLGRIINVYTMFGVYIIDYGIYGSIIILSIFGYISGILEKLYSISNENEYIKILYSLNITCLFLGCFYDYYLSSGFVWLIILLSWIFFPKGPHSSLKCNPV